MRRFPGHSFLIVVLLLNAIDVFGQQWGSVLTVSTSAGNYRPRIGVVRNGDPVVCWGDQSSNKVMFSRFSSGAFLNPIDLTPSGQTAYIQDWTGPEMAVTGDTIYIVFKLKPETTAGIYLVRSIDGGMSFSDTIRIDPPNGNIPWMPSVRVDANGNPIVVYMDNDAGWVDPRYVVTKGFNLGNTFTIPVDATRNIAPGEVCDCCPASMVVKDSLSIVLFRNNQNNLRTIFASRSTDQGDSFTGSYAVDVTGSVSNQCQSTGPVGAIYHDSLYTFWRGNTGGLKIWLSSSGLDSITPVVHKKISQGIPGSVVQNYPRLAVEGDLSVLAWQETYSANSEVICSFDSTGKISNLGLLRDTINTNHTGGQVNADVALKNKIAHFVWQDIPSGNVLYRQRSFLPAPVSFSETVSQDLLRVFPNPFNESLVFQTNLSSYIYELQDISGRVLVIGAGKGKEARIDTEFVSSGVYFLILKADDYSITRKIIKSDQER